MERESSDLKSASPELAMIAEFMQQSLPFNELSDRQLQWAVTKTLVQYHCRGDRFSKDTAEMGLRIVRSGAVEIRDDKNKLLDRLGEGESFHIGGLNAENGEVQALVIEDALLYLLPDEHYRKLREENRKIDRYFSSQRSRRLRRAARYEPVPNSMMREVSSLMSTELLTVNPAMEVKSVASAMTRRRVSSAFVVESGDLVGIVTDRDLRVRFAAEGLPADTAVQDIMTRNPESIDGSDTLFATTLLMTQRGYHHFPVMCDGKLRGIVTTSDLILAKQDDPVYLVQHISRQVDVPGLVNVVSGMPMLLVQWVKSVIRAQQVSQILTAISDAITVRLIQLAANKLGPAPVPYCWTGFGSQARGEQLLGADQDNGLIISDEMRAEHRPWFTAMAKFVCDDSTAAATYTVPGELWRPRSSGASR